MLFMYVCIGILALVLCAKIALDMLVIIVERTEGEQESDEHKELAREQINVLMRILMRLPQEKMGGESVSPLGNKKAECRGMMGEWMSAPAAKAIGEALNRADTEAKVDHLISLVEKLKAKKVEKPVDQLPLGTVS